MYTYHFANFRNENILPTEWPKTKLSNDSSKQFLTSSLSLPSLTTKRSKTEQDLNINLENNEWFSQGVYGDNITGWPINIVPNIVHYVLFENHRISFVHMISIFSVLRNQKPEIIYIHCDCESIIPDDVNWKQILSFVNQTNETKLIIRRVEKPTQIYGIKLNPNWVN